MIGGDRCTKYPARMVASILLKAIGIEDSIKIFTRLNLQDDLEHKKMELNTIISQFKRANNRFPSENIPLTSSTGRIFDAVSYLLGASTIKTYRGEPAMRLEGLASRGNPDNIILDIGFHKKNGKFIIESSNLILDILSLLEDPKHNKADIAAKFQIELGNAFANIAIKIARNNNIGKIGLTGGVAYNYYFSKAIKEKIIKEGYTFLEHDSVPPGDAGISTGQLVGGLFQFQD